MHLILHLRGCGISLVLLPQPYDPRRLLGLLRLIPAETVVA